MKTCEKCGTENEADVRFCVNCGNKSFSDASAPKNNVHMDMPAQKRPVVIEQKEIGKQFCEQCGTANESDVKFCVSCGNNMTGNFNMPRPNNQINMNGSYQTRPIADMYTTDQEMMQLRSVPNPVMVMWESILFPEKMIVVGAILNCLLAIFWVSGSYLSVPMAVFYFATMATSLWLIHISRGVSLLKKAELSRWQIAIGAFWLSWLFNIVFNSYSYNGYSGNSGILVFNTIFSIVMLSGAIMLQGTILQHVFSQKKNNK